MGKMSWEEAERHVGDLMPESIRSRAMDVIQHYIWVTGKGDMKRGYCTKCLTWMPVSGVKHKGYGTCSCCGQKIQYRELRFRRKNLLERTFLLEYHKSLIEADTVVCVGYDIEAQWDNLTESMMNAGLEQLPVKVLASEVCVIRYGTGGTRYLRDYSALRREKRDVFTKVRECRSGYKPWFDYFLILDKPQFVNAISGTSFERVLKIPLLQNSGAMKWYEDMINLLDRIAAYPTLEYIYKMGYVNLANAVLAREAGNLIKKSGKGPRDVLKLAADQWAEIRGKKLDVTYELLIMAKMARDHHLNLPIERYQQVYKIIRSSWTWNGTRNETTFSVITRRYPQIKVQDLLLYCERKKISLLDYYDYLGQLEKLEMNMSSEEYLFPKDFQEEHAELSKRIKIEASKLKEKQLRRFVAKLKRYEFKSDGMVLRPFKNPAEVIKEGTALHHCVGSYAERYTLGETILCCLRRENDPDKPLYTVEFTTKDRFVQCRGDHNRIAAEDEQALAKFWIAFNLHLKKYIKDAEKAERISA
jgi:hypothetical protein